MKSEYWRAKYQLQYQQYSTANLDNANTFQRFTYGIPVSTTLVLKPTYHLTVRTGQAHLLLTYLGLSGRSLYT